MPNTEYKILYLSDMKRYNNKASHYLKKLHKYLRLCETSKSVFSKIIYRLAYRSISHKHGIEIPYNTHIGYGLYLGHPFNITINERAVIGNNCNIHKGVVIGQENRGSRKGAPKIGNNVWIGINAAIVGNVTIGNDVLIAPNSFVNCNIPDHSIVLGNPCIIKECENATKDYINNIYEVENNK